MADFAWWCDACTEREGRPVASADCGGHEPLSAEEIREAVADHVEAIDPAFAAKLRTAQFLLPGPFRAHRGKVD